MELIDIGDKEKSPNFGFFFVKGNPVDTDRNVNIVSVDETLRLENPSMS